MPDFDCSQSREHSIFEMQPNIKYLDEDSTYILNDSSLWQYSDTINCKLEMNWIKN